MAAERDDQGFIPGVYNYCDRWCERCPFASRCRSYAMELTLRIDGGDGELARAAESLADDPAEEGAGEDVLAEAEDGLSDEEVEQAMLVREVAHALAEVHPLTEGAESLGAVRSIEREHLGEGVDAGDRLACQASIVGAADVVVCVPDALNRER